MSDVMDVRQSQSQLVATWSLYCSLFNVQTRCCICVVNLNLSKVDNSQIHGMLVYLQSEYYWEKTILDLFGVVIWKSLTHKSTSLCCCGCHKLLFYDDTKWMTESVFVGYLTIVVKLDQFREHYWEYSQNSDCFGISGLHVSK